MLRMWRMVSRFRGKARVSACACRLKDLGDAAGAMSDVARGGCVWACASPTLLGCRILPSPFNGQRVIVVAPVGIRRAGCWVPLPCTSVPCVASMAGKWEPLRLPPTPSLPTPPFAPSLCSREAGSAHGQVRLRQDVHAVRLGVPWGSCFLRGLRRASGIPVGSAQTPTWTVGSCITLILSLARPPPALAVCRSIVFANYLARDTMRLDPTRELACVLLRGL